MELTNISDRKNDFIKRLSRGYKQRVGLAQAIVHNPDVVILDEPTVGLDPKQIIEVRKLIKGLAGEHTIVLSTHILPEVSMTCDRVVIINKGKIAAVDTPENLTTQLKGAERIHMEVRGGSAEEVHNVVNNLDGLLKVEVNQLEDSDHLSLTIESEPGKDLRSRLAALVIGHGYELYELKSVSLSLEDIFLQLTTDEDVSQTKAEKQTA
jgi:ABC-2 type transport system ATP-binding protein